MSHKPYLWQLPCKICKKCNRKNHFAIGCYSKSRKEVQMVIQDEYDSVYDAVSHLVNVNEVVCVQSVEDDTQNVWSENINVMRKEVKFKLDTGS